MSPSPLPASPYEIARDALALAENLRSDALSVLGRGLEGTARRMNLAADYIERTTPIVEAAEAQEAAWRTWDERAQVATSAEVERVRWLAAVKETEQAVRAARSAQ